MNKNLIIVAVVLVLIALYYYYSSSTVAAAPAAVSLTRSTITPLGVKSPDATNVSAALAKLGIA